MDAGAIRSDPFDSIKRSPVEYLGIKNLHRVLTLIHSSKYVKRTLHLFSRSFSRVQLYLIRNPMTHYAHPVNKHSFADAPM